MRQWEQEKYFGIGVLRLSDFELDKAERVKGVLGADVQRIIVLFPVGGLPTPEGAVDDALEKGNGDVLTDAVLYTRAFYIPLIYGEIGWYGKGDVVKTRRN